MLRIPVVAVIVVNVVMEVVVVVSGYRGCGVVGVPTTTTTTATTTTPPSPPPNHHHQTQLSISKLFDIFACPWRDLCRHRLRETDPRSSVGASGLFSCMADFRGRRRLQF